jgi:LacI family transcriptional regulator
VLDSKDGRETGSARSGRSHATIQSIAEIAKVHPSTVSRALDPNPSRRVAAVTVERIKKIAAANNFEPNPLARSLRTHRTMTLGLVIPRLEDNVLAVVFESAGSAALALGYQAITVSTGDDPERAQQAVGLLLDRRVDGLILATARIVDPVVDSLSSDKVPFVLLNRSNGAHPCVRADDEQGAYLATRHLLERGHRDIGHIAGVEGTSTSLRRLAGYRKALKEIGLQPRENLIFHSQLGIDSGIQFGRRLLTREVRPTAIFASNDYIAIGVMAAARDLGIAIPQELAIVGYNDTSIGQALPVPLTSVAIPLKEMGARVVQTLIQQIDGQPSAAQVFPAELIVRASSDTWIR